MAGVERQNRYKTNNECIKHLPQTSSMDPLQHMHKTEQTELRHNMDVRVLRIDLNNTGSRIQWHQVKPAEMTNLEYQDGGQSAFSIVNKLPYFKEIYGN